MLMSEIDLCSQGLGVVERYPLIRVPSDNLDSGLFVVGDSGAIGDDLIDFRRRQHAGRASACAAVSAIAKLTASRHASRVLHREAAAIEPETQYNTLWIDIVAPQELETHLDFRQVCVSLGNRAETVDTGIPDTVDVIRHHVEPVEIRLHSLEIEAAEIPVRGRLLGSVAMGQQEVCQ